MGLGLSGPRGARPDPVFAPRGSVAPVEVGRLPELIELLAKNAKGVVITQLSSGFWRVGVVATYRVGGDDRYRDDWATNGATLAEAVEAVLNVEQKNAADGEAST